MIIYHVFFLHIDDHHSDRQKIDQHFLNGCTKGDLEKVSWMLKDSDQLGIDLQAYGGRALNLAGKNEKVADALRQEFKQKGIIIKEKTRSKVLRS